jgi:tetratricopeptide (TPR) repeat protein
LLGGASVERGGVTLDGPPAQRHRLALLALLLVARGKPVTRDKLIAYLWPERDAEHGRNLLKVSVHQLRKAFGDGAIRSVGDQLSVDPAIVHSDLADFQDAVARGDAGAAVRAYGGPFLDGFFLKAAEEFEHWVAAQRQQLAKDHDRARAAISGQGISARFASLPEPAAPATSAGAAKRHGVLGVAGAVAIAAIVLIAAAFLRGRFALGAPTPAPASGATVAIAPFQVVGGDSAALALREGMVDVLAQRFTGQGSARAIEPAAALAAWRKASGGAARPSLESSLGVARAHGTSQLLLGQVLAADGTQEQIATLYAVPGGGVLARSNVKSPASRPLDAAVDQLAAELMARAAREPDDRLPDLVRRPLPVLRRFLEARARYRVGQYAAAESLYATALDGDSTFALAGLGLAMSQSWTTITGEYGRGRDAARRWQAPLAPRDRMFVDAFFAPDPVNRPRVAPAYQKMWEDMVEHFPDWAESWYELGDRYYHFGGLAGLGDATDRARGAFRRALALDTALAAPLHHLTEIYVARGETNELRAIAERYFARNPAVSRDRSAVGWEVAFALNDQAWLRRVRASFDSLPVSELNRVVWVTDANGWPRDDLERALRILVARASMTNEHASAQTLRFAAALNAGRLPEARDAARALGGVYPDRPAAALFDAYAAMFGEVAIDTALMREAVRRLEPFAAARVAGDFDRRNHAHQAMCLIGYARSLDGALPDARAMLDRIRRELAADTAGGTRDGRVCTAALEASVAVAGSRGAAGALARLDTLLLTQRVPPSAALAAGSIVAARLYETTGRLDLALAAARRREHLTGHPLFLSTQLRLEARLADKAGDRDGSARATRHYEALR